LVSANPISGTVPSSLLFAGSTETVCFVDMFYAIPWMGRLTRDDYLRPVLRVHPFPVDETLCLDQTGIFKPKLSTWTKNHECVEPGQQSHSGTHCIRCAGHSVKYCVISCGCLVRSCKGCGCKSGRRW
jgi:hypothetical protein